MRSSREGIKLCCGMEKKKKGWLVMALGPGLLGFYRVLVRADNDKSRLN